MYLSFLNRLNMSDILIIIILFILFIIFLYFSFKLKKLRKISKKDKNISNENNINPSKKTKSLQNESNFEKIDNRKKSYSNKELESLNRELKDANKSINKIMEKTTNIYEEVLKIEKINSEKISGDELKLNNVEPGPHLTAMIENINNNIDPNYINMVEEEQEEKNVYISNEELAKINLDKIATSQNELNLQKLNREINSLKEEEKLLKQELYLLLNEMKNIVALKTSVPISEITPKKTRIEELIVLISKHEKTIIDLIKYKNTSQNLNDKNLELDFLLNKINPIIQREGNINK